MRWPVALWQSRMTPGRLRVGEVGEVREVRWSSKELMVWVGGWVVGNRDCVGGKVWCGR